MEGPYSKLSHPSPESKTSTFSSTDTLLKDEGSAITQKPSLSAWISTVWSLALHCILSVGITLFVLVYMDQRPTNVTDRVASVQVIGGNVTLPFAPIQSDIVTILSSMIVVQKGVLTAWMAPLCWRAAIFLMERRGLDRRDLKFLVRYRLLIPRTYLASLPTLIISTLLLTGLAAHLSSPILTGSIAWVATNQPIRDLKIDPVRFKELEAGSRTMLPSSYVTDSNVRSWLSQKAWGLISVGWGRDTDKRVHKRISNSVEGLPLNSTIENVTLPYFVIDSIKWVEDISHLPNYTESNYPENLLEQAYDLAIVPDQPKRAVNGVMALIPNYTTPTNWSTHPLVSSTIEDTRLLVFWVGTVNYTNVTQAFPPNTYIQESGNMYYAFAWVAFKAGVGRCKEYQCIVESRFTIRSNGSIELEPHPLTFHALSMVLDISISLVSQNVSIPSSWRNADDYVEAVLISPRF
ncbi:transmembrane protein, putative, partial [Rhizoctonia solani AG-3 Rhs1AP]